MASDYWRDDRTPEQIKAYERKMALWPLVTCMRRGCGHSFNLKPGRKPYCRLCGHAEARPATNAEITAMAAWREEDAMRRP